MSRRRSPSTADDDPTPPRGSRVVDPNLPAQLAGASSGDWDDEWDDEWDEPNYLVRRALVVTAVVIGVAITAVVASRLIGGRDDSRPDAVDARWDTTIVLAHDEVRILDRESGDEIDSFDSTIDLLDAQSLVSGDVLVTMTDAGAIALIDLNDGTTRRGRSGVDASLGASRDNPSIVIAGPTAGGDMTIIDAAGRNVFGVADVAGLNDPLIFDSDIRVNPSGSHVAIPVPNAFQSFVIDVTEETSVAFAGRAIAISAEFVVTEQPAGDESEIEFHALDGERLGSVDVPAPRASLLTSSGSLVLVAEDGSVRVVTSDGSVDDADPILDDDGAPVIVSGGSAVFGGTRLAVATDNRVIVLDDNGAIVGTAVGQVTTAPPRATRCLVVGGSRSTDPSTVVDLDDGSIVTTLEQGLPAAASVDGCTVAFVGGTDNLLTDGELIEVDTRSISDVAPDGAAVVAHDGRNTELVHIGAEDNPTELADEPVIVRFGQRG